jgi:hypothetical protein
MFVISLLIWMSRILVKGFKWVRKRWLFLLLLSLGNLSFISFLCLLAQEFDAVWNILKPLSIDCLALVSVSLCFWFVVICVHVARMQSPTQQILLLTELDCTRKAAARELIRESSFEDSLTVEEKSQPFLGHEEKRVN